MTEQTRLQRSKPSDTAFTQSSQSTSQGTQLFVDNSSRVNAQSELLDTLTAASPTLVQRVKENEPEYLDLDETQKFPKDTIRGDQIEVPEGAPDIRDHDFDINKRFNPSYQPDRKRLEQAEAATKILSHASNGTGKFASFFNAVFDGLLNPDKNK